VTGASWPSPIQPRRTREEHNREEHNKDYGEQQRQPVGRLETGLLGDFIILIHDFKARIAEYPYIGF
jgi:hypothetical protein